MAEPFLPYEIGLLVLRYLYEVNCPSSAASLLDEMPCLENACKDPARFNSPSVLGSLRDILNDYGRTKLMVRKLATQLSDWKTIPDDTLNPQDTLTTQLRQISQLLYSNFNPTTKNRLAEEVNLTQKPKKLLISKAVQTTPDTLVIRTKKVATTCTTEDGVMDGCWSLCSCVHSSKLANKHLVEKGVQPDIVNLHDQSTQFEEPELLFELSQVEEDQDQGDDNQTLFQEPGSHNIGEEKETCTADVEMDDEGIGNANAATGEDNDIESEGDSKTKTLAEATMLFYNVMLEDPTALVDLANQQLNFNQQFGESPVKQDVTVVPPLSSGADFEVEKFMQQFVKANDEPDPGEEIEDGEIPDDSQDNIGEFQAAEKNLVSLFKNKQEAGTSTPITAVSSSSSQVTSRNPPSSRIVHGVQVWPALNIGEKCSQLHNAAAVKEPVQHELSQLDSQAIARSQEKPDKPTNETAPPVKAEEILEVKYSPKIFQPPPVRNHSAWHKIGRRSIQPKIPDEPSVPVFTSPSPEPEYQSKISESQQPPPNFQNASAWASGSGSHRNIQELVVESSPPPISPSKNNFQHLQGQGVARRTQEASLPSLPTPQTSVNLQTQTLQKACHSTPRKNTSHIRNLRFSTPQNANKFKQENTSSNQIETSKDKAIKPISPLSNKPKSQKTLFANKPTQPHDVQNERKTAHKDHVPPNGRKDVSSKSQAPSSKSVNQDRKRDDSPDKRRLTDRRDSQRSKRRISPISSPSKKPRIDSKVKQEPKREEARKQDKSRSKPQTDEKNKQNSSSSINSEKPTGRCSVSNSKVTPTAIAPASKVPTSIPERERNSESKRKRKEPEKKISGDLPIITTTAPQQPSEVPVLSNSSNCGNNNLSLTGAQILPPTLPYNNHQEELSNFTVPRTPRYKGSLDAYSDWESQSCDSLDTIETVLKRTTQLAQPFPLLTPIKDNDLPITPGKNLYAQDFIQNESKKSGSKSMFVQTLNAALHNQNQSLANNTQSVSKPKQAERLPTYSTFPQGHGQLVNQKSDTKIQEVKPTVKTSANIKKPNPVIKNEIKLPVPGHQNHSHHQPQQSLNSSISRNISPVIPNSSRNQPMASGIPFSVSGQRKWLTHRETATAFSLCQLSQLGSPDPRIMLTPRASPSPESEENKHSLDQAGIEDLLSIVHGGRK